MPQLIVAGQMGIAGKINCVFRAAEVERRLGLIRQLRDLGCAQRLVPNGDIIDACGGKAAAIARPGADR